jgi:hypothetical protein
MFNRPDDMSEPELAGLCKRYNFVLKQGGNHRQAILDEMGIAKTRMTADYDVKNLEAHTRQFWEKLHERWRKDGTLAVDAGTSPVPTLEAIGKTENPDNWVEGKSEDSIKKYRAKTIATARVDLDKPKEAQVKVEALADANEQLRKAGSFIRLEVAGKPDADGFVKVRPVWNMEQAMSKTGAESHEKLVRMNAPRQQGLRPSDEAVKETQFVSWADCHRTAQTIMGSEDTASGIEDREGVVMKGLDEPIRPVPKSRTKEIAGATDHGANRAMHGFFGAAMPKMRQKLVAKQKEGALTKAETELLRQIDAQGQGENLKNFRQAYRTVCDDPDLAREFSAEFGINEAIVPRVGTAFAQINDEMEKSDGEKTGEDLWNFHFAGVVLVNPDGSYMTLENLSVEDSTAVNDNWYFAVYDPKNGKSFHDVNAEDDHVGDHPITLLLDKVPQK